MKKIISVLLILCLCFAFCACKGGKTPSGSNNVSTPSTGNQSSNDSSSNNPSSNNTSTSDPSASTPTTSQPSGETDKYADKVFASARQFSKNAVAQKRTLDNTVYKLKNNKKLNVLYYGGSVTVGVGSTDGNSWAKLTEEWLKSTYPDAQITCTNSAIGGTGVYYGNIRAELDAIPYAPDLMFIEFAINDAYEDFDYSQSAYYLEMLIKRMNKQFPQTDIIVLLITDKGKMGKQFENADAHKAVANHYGIPCFDLGADLAKAVNDGKGTWEDYFTDYSHPSNKGYAVYTNTVIEGLKKLLAVEGKALKNHTMPKEDYVIGGINMNYKMLTADKVQMSEGWETGKRKLHSFPMLFRPTKSGAKITIEFEGNSFGLFMNTEKGNTVTATIDGKEKKIFVKADEEGANEKLIFDNLAAGKHKIELEYTGKARFYVYAVFIG